VKEFCTREMFLKKEENRKKTGKTIRKERDETLTGLLEVCESHWGIPTGQLVRKRGSKYQGKKGGPDPKN